MELFIEFVFTIALSLLFSFILAKLLSTTDHHHQHSQTKFEAKSKKCDFESETELGFVATKVVDDDDDDEEELGESNEVSEGSREVEIIDLMENSCEWAHKLFDESTERVGLSEIEMDLVKDEVGVSKSEEGLLFDDDWEGIERSELDKVFGNAVVFVGSKSNADKIASLGSDLKMQLFALHKVATEGPCHEPQPMALKVSARAKWSAWQQLGNMSPDEAMEQYINLLSRSMTGWMQDGFGGESKQVFSNAETSECKLLQPNQPGEVYERNLDELKPCVEGLDVTGSQVHF